MYPGSLELYPAIQELKETCAQYESGTSTRATNQETAGVKSNKRKFSMCYINSDAGEEISSINDLETTNIAESHK